MNIKNYFRIIIQGVAILGLAIFLFSPNFALAGRGCCSWHGGQAYCDTTTGRWVCNDGTYSPTCTCWKEPAPVYIPTPKPSPTPVCAINGQNYYSDKECKSEEHKNGVRKLYNNLLGRNANEDEVNYWASEEPDIKKIETEILNSDEYKQKHPSPTLKPTVEATANPTGKVDEESIIVWVLIALGLIGLTIWGITKLIKKKG